MNNDLINIIKDLGNPKILVIGDLILDTYISGTIKRISPEAPIPILETTGSERMLLGGAANVAANLKTLGAQVFLSGVLGDDPESIKFIDLANKRGINTDGVFMDKGRPTTVKTRVVAGSQQLVRIDCEHKKNLDKKLVAEFCEYYENICDEINLVIISDYGKGMICKNLLHDLIASCHKRNIQILVDPKGRDYSLYRGTDILTPNKKEAAEALGLQNISDDIELRGAGINIMKTIESQHLVITCGKEGMAVFDDGEYELLPTEAREVFDVTGAGDTVIAALGLCLAEGVGLRESARLANIAAGVVVAKSGVATVTREEIVSELEESVFSQKTFTTSGWHSLVSKLATEKARGAKIVFTNGCFDLLHPGHLQLLQQASKFGDVLVVGLNTDASIKRLKGEKRPILSEYERSHIISSLNVVDCVVLFDEDTPEKLINEIRPDILVKGADYKKEDVVGGNQVESWGGSVELVPIVDGFSSTDIVSRVLDKYKG